MDNSFSGSETRVSESSGINECLKNRPNYKCSHCQAKMMIAGKIERNSNEERAEGKEVVKRYTCYSCLKEMIPVKI